MVTLSVGEIIIIIIILSLITFIATLMLYLILNGTTMNREKIYNETFYKLENEINDIKSHVNDIDSLIKDLFEILSVDDIDDTDETL